MRFIEGLRGIQNEHLISFHMPGHKNGRLLSSYFSDWMSMDITEIPGADNLHDPNGIILETENRLSAYFGTRESHMLVNGSTAGLHAAINAVCDPGDVLIVSRESHKAVYSAMLIGDIQARYIYPEIDSQVSSPRPVTLGQVQRAFDEHPDARGVVLTSPNYLGMIADVTAISDWLHERNKVLIVDEAHGAHLKLGSQLPSNAVDCEADIVVQSFHKTLPALTQAAVVHVNSSRVDTSRLRDWLGICQTSSPSYLIMASIDGALEMVEQRGEELMKSLLQDINLFHEAMDSHPTLEIFRPQGTLVDPTRLVLTARDAYSVDFSRLEMKLRECYGIQVEYSYSHGIVLIPTIANIRQDFEALADALFDVNYEEMSNTLDYDTIRYEYPESADRLRSAFYGEKETVGMDRSSGRISGDYIIPYPPGVPLIVPGEVITERLIQVIKQLGEFGTSVMGITEGRIKVLKEGTCSKKYLNG